MSEVTAALRDRLSSRYRRLQRWLVDEAYPLWMRRGFDAATGGFEERLGHDGAALLDARRARVQPRQIYSFSMAPRLGVRDDVEPIVTSAFDYLLARYRRDDGLYRTLVDRTGAPLDDRPFLYDQAFVLLACAAAGQTFPRLRSRAVDAARDLRSRIQSRLRAARGFHNGDPSTLPLQSNPHMHVFEACQAWMASNDDEEWRNLADEIGGLALERFIDANGALREFFDAEWRPASSPDGRIVEPGHQFEWAWLLLRWDPKDARGGRTAATRLIEIGEAHGVRNGVAINALLDDFSIKDDVARLWPQTERLKAAALSAAMSGEQRHFEHAADAAEGLMTYFEMPTRGLWRDRRKPDGTFIDEPSPASSFYHIVAGAIEFGELVGGTGRTGGTGGVGRVGRVRQVG